MKKDLEAIRKGLLKLHLSTAERLSVETEFNFQIVKYIKENQNIIDIGGGIYPLMFPWDELKPQNYILIEKDSKCCEAVSLFAKASQKPNLIAIEDEFEKVNLKDLLKTLNVDEFDIALVFKTIIVLSRKNQALLHKLAKIPARKFIITAPTNSLIKGHEISKSERKVLEDFIKLAKGRIIGEVDTKTEFGFVVEKE